MDIIHKDIMSISNHKNFINKGGDIAFYIRERKVAFQINLLLLEEKGIKIDNSIISIAEIINYKK